jgi:hypothetical protein
MLPKCSHTGFFKLHGTNRIFGHLVADAAAAFYFLLFKIKIKLFYPGRTGRAQITLTTSASPLGLMVR